MGWFRNITRGLWASSSKEEGPQTTRPQSAGTTQIEPENQTRSGKYSTDSPIQNPGDDKFHRLPFAHRIADALIHRTDPESIVVGIYGAWGQGKTSVLNLIDHRLRSHEDIKILRFNPWRYQNEDQLLVAFFEAVANLLDVQLYTLVERGARSRGGQTLSKGSSSVPFGEGFGGIIELLSTVGVEQLKERIEEKLINAQKRIVVLVDDIDRLDKNEIFAVFRLVKLTANLKYVSFILAFDDEVVSDALQDRYAHTRKESGKAFLEKIIQVPLELPQVQLAILRTHCLNGIVQALEEAGINISQEEANRYLSGFNPGLMPAIRTPRAVMRYHNALTFNLPILRGELNVVDMMLLEGIRLFYPTVYDSMRSDRDTFLAKRQLWEDADNVKKRVKEKYDKALANLAPEDHKACADLLGVLFPRLEGILSNWHRQYDQKQADLGMRISSERYFDRYFMLNIPQGDISDVRIDRIIAMAREKSDEIEALEQEIAQALKDADAEAVIHKLEIRDEGLTTESIRCLSLALCKNGKNIPHTSTFFSLGGPRRQAAWFISNLLTKVPDLQGRIDLAKEIVSQAESPAFAVEILFSLWTDKDGPKPGAFTQEQKGEVGKWLAKRFGGIAASGELFAASDEDAQSLIMGWNNLGDSTQLSGHLSEHIAKDPSYASRLITILRTSATSLGEVGSHKMDLEFPTYQLITKLVPAEQMIQAIRATYGDSAEPSMEFPMSRRGDDNNYRSAQQFLWRHAHNTAGPTGEEQQT